MATPLPACSEELNELLSKSTGALGIALIVTNDYRTSSNATLEGTLKDATKAQNVFESLNTICYMKHNSTASQMFDAVCAVASCSSYPDAFKWIVFIFSGHGDNQVIKGQDGQIVRIANILEMFQPSQNRVAAKIPKILLFDTCRGDGITKSTLVPKGGQVCESIRVPENGNMLVGYSTLSHCKSYESGKEGGIWTSFLLNRLGRDECSINDILTETNGDIIKYFQNKEVEIQQPECHSTLWSTVNLKEEAIKAKEQGIKFTVPNTVSTQSIGNDCSVPASNKQRTSQIYPRGVKTDIEMQKLNQLVKEKKLIKKRRYDDCEDDNVILTITLMDNSEVKFDTSSTGYHHSCINDAREHAAQMAVEYISNKESVTPKAAGIPPPPPSTPGSPPPSTPGCPPFSTPDLSHVKINSSIRRNMWIQELKNIIIDQLGMETPQYECVELGNGFRCILTHSLFIEPIISGGHPSKQDARQNAARKAIEEIKKKKKQ